MNHRNRQNLARALRRPAIFVLTLLVIEFLDEFVFGARETAWPLIRSDLQLSYEQIGIVLAVPALIATVIEPVLGILADVWKRRVLIVGGGGLFVLSLALTAISRDPLALLLTFVLFYPASGAFVSLSQSTLMDSAPERHEQNMARWTFAGSAGVLIGSLAMGGLAAIGGSWRLVFAFAALLAFGVLLVARRFPFTNPVEDDEIEPGFVAGIRSALQAVRRREVLRWLALLEFANLMQDVLYGYLALYFVDVVGVQEVQAGIAVAIWTGVGLLADLVLIPLLERVQGLSFVRASAALELVLFPLFLLVPGFAAKLVILALLSFFTAGWYPVLQGQLYSSMPGQSGTVMSVGSVSGLLGSLIPLGIGLLADRFGLNIALWLLIAGPMALTIGLPRKRQAHTVSESPNPMAIQSQTEVS
ncbi:MAG: MFS transporter [Aggregatilineales bacterium]